DGDFSRQRFIERYNDDLANGIGNLVARVAKLCEKSGHEFRAEIGSPKDHPVLLEAMESFQINRALEYVWQLIKAADQQIDTTKTWKLEGKELVTVLEDLVNQIATIATLLDPFMPAASGKILAQYT